MRYIVLVLIIFCINVCVKASIFSPEEVDTKEKAFAAVHQLMKARYDFHREYLDYLKDATIPEKERLDLMSEYSGIDRSQVSKGFMDLSLSFLEKDLAHFKRVSNLSSDPRLLTILHLELSFVKRMGLLGAEERLSIQKKVKEHKRKSAAQAVLQYTGFSSEFNDAPCQEESLAYLNPFLTDGHRNFEKKMRSRAIKADLEIFSGAAQCNINANDLGYLQDEAFQLVTNRIPPKLKILEGVPAIGKEKAFKFWEKSNGFFSEALDCLLTTPIKILEFGQKLEALHNQENILDQLVARYTPKPLPAAKPRAELVTSSATANPKPLALALPPLPEMAPEIPESSVLALSETAPEAVTFPEEEVSKAHFRRWTLEEKAAQTQLPMAAAAAEPPVETEDDFTQTIRDLMSKTQLDFFREVVPKILNPILKKNLLMDRNGHNINLFIPYKETLDERKLIYFHVPHGKNSVASHRAFWRQQLKKALTETGWLQS
jgi:hypothetical protein